MEKSKTGTPESENDMKEVRERIKSGKIKLRLMEPERMLKARIEAAEEELSRKLVKISEIRARTDVSGPQRSRRRYEVRQEDAEKNKKKGEK